MKKTSLALAGALALTLAACSDADTTADETVPVVETTTSETATDGNTDDGGDSAGNTADADGNDDATSDTDTSAGAPDRTIDLLDYEFDVSLDEAIEISNSETGGGTIHQIGMDWSDGAWVWEIDTIGEGREWELEINATTGEVREVDMDDDDDDERAVDPNAAVDYRTAMETAVAEVPGKVTQWELDWDDGRQVYTIEIDSGNNDVDVVVDADTGDVVEIDD